jgi:hypothetical protein
MSSFMSAFTKDRRNRWGESQFRAALRLPRSI